MSANHAERVQERVEAQLTRENTRTIQKEQGLAYARTWRARNKPLFDALYGPETCACGTLRPICAARQ